jgi:hypothetical protein
VAEQQVDHAEHCRKIERVTTLETGAAPDMSALLLALINRYLAR